MNVFVIHINVWLIKKNMTAISAIISKDWISVASDSLLTEIISIDNVRHIEFKKSKIVPIRKFKASAAYWGLAKVGYWRTYDFLKKMAVDADGFQSFESFANYVCAELKAKLDKFVVKNPSDIGIGIHLAGFEDFHGELVPELFLISNYSNTSYKELKNIEVSRNLYGTLKDEYKNGETTLFDQKQKVKEFLEAGQVFIFNNGDPRMFNPAAKAMIEMFIDAKMRNVLRDKDLKVFLTLSSRPIEIIKNVQKDLFEKQYIRVGGKIHNLLITKIGSMISTSGDNEI